MEIDYRLPPTKKNGQPLNSPNSHPHKPKPKPVTPVTLLASAFKEDFGKLQVEVSNKDGIIAFAHKLILMLEIQSRKTESLEMKAGYLGAIQSVKLLALVIDPSGLQQLAGDEALAIKLMQASVANPDMYIIPD